MTILDTSHSIPIFCLGAALTASLVTACGVDVRPRMPTLQARAVIAPATFRAETAPSAAPSQTYTAPASAAPVGMEPMPDDVATAGQYEQSGGATRATAEVVAIGSTLIGRVGKGTPRYYVIDLTAGDSLKVKAYTRVVSGYAGNFSFKVIEPDDVKLRELYGSAHSKTEWERESMQTAAKQSGRHLIRVTTNNASMEYKVTISGEAVGAS